MPLVCASDLTSIQAQQANALPDTCTLRAVTLSADGSGGWTEGTSDTSSVPCRMVMQGGAEGILAGQLTAQRTYMLTVPTTYTITPRTRVIKGGVTFEVVSVNEPASWLTVKRAVCNRVEA